MPKIKMTRRDFFEYYKNIVSQIDDPNAAEWLFSAGKLSEEDFVKDDEDVRVDIDEFADKNFDAGSLMMKFGLREEKANELASLFKSGNTANDFANKVADKFKEINEYGKSKELNRTDETRKLFGWCDELYNAVDIIADYSRKDASVKNEPITFHMKDKDGRDVELTVGEADRAINEGKLVFAKGKSFDDIPLLKDKNLIISGAVLSNNDPEKVIRKTETKIPEVTGLWNRFCRLLGIETEGTRDYFEAKRREKLRDTEYNEKIKAFKDAKQHLKNGDYSDALKTKDAEFKEINGYKTLNPRETKRIGIEEEIKQIKEKKKEEAAKKEKTEEKARNKAVDEKFFDTDKNSKVVGLKDEFKNMIVEEAKKKYENSNINSFDDLDLYVRGGGFKYNIKNNAADWVKDFREGNDIYVLPKNSPIKTPAYYGDMRKNKALFIKTNLKDDLDLTFSSEYKPTSLKVAVNSNDIKPAIINVAKKMEFLYTAFKGNRPIHKGESKEKWMSDAYVNLRTKPAPTVEELNKWINENREAIIDNYMNNTRDDVIKMTKVKNTLEVFDGSALLEIIKNERVNSLDDYYTPDREKYVSSLNAEKEEKNLSDLDKGKKIISETRKQAYLTLMDKNANPMKIMNSIAAIKACHELTTGENKNAAIEKIGKSPMTIEHYVKNTCKEPIMNLLVGQYEISKDYYKKQLNKINPDDRGDFIENVHKNLANTQIMKERDYFRNEGFYEFIRPFGEKSYPADEKERFEIYDKINNR